MPTLRSLLAPTFAPLRNRLFAGVWTASLVSNFGTMIQSVAAAWVMTSIDGRADMVALVQSSTSLPIMFFSLLAGALADVFDRRLVMLWAQAWMFVVSAALAGLTWAGHLTPWWLLAFTFLIGCGGSLYGPAWQSSVGEQVPRADLPAAISLNSLGFNLARSAGPALGGVIVATLGASVAFLINAVSYLGLIGVVSGWKRPPVDRTLPPERIGEAMAAGLRYVASAPAIRAVLVRSMLFGIPGSAVWALLPLVSRDVVHGGAGVYGVLFGSLGVGAVIGALVSTPVRRTFANEAVVDGATAVFAVGIVGVAASSSVYLSVPALILTGTGWVVALSTFNVIVQVSSPRWVVGRTLAVYQMVTFGGLAVGSWLWGHVAAAHGVPLAMAASAATMLVGPLIGLSRPLPAAETLDLGPSHSWADPDVRLAELNGPVRVSVEYLVDPVDVADFRHAMAERRRIRRRDGARRWALLQDVESPERWVESFASPSWTEHLRSHHRVTVADREIEARAAAFHRGSEPPKVRHLLERGTSTREDRVIVADTNLAPQASGAG
ncbi:MAG: MFS transporter [Janthinobacterium lividum]